MSASWRRAFLATSAVLVLPPAACPGAFAQTGHAWVDPPVDPPAAGSVAPAQPAETAPVAPAAPTARHADPASPPSEAAPRPSPPVRAARPEQAPAAEAKPEPSIRSAEPRAPLPAEAAPGVADRRRGNELAARADAAQELTRSYFDYWSSPNAETLAATPEFYGSNVVFH